MKKFLLLATFVLLAAVLFSCALKKGDSKNDSAASGETTKSIGTDEITTVGVTTEMVTNEMVTTAAVTTEAVTTAARIYIDINEVGSVNIDSMKLTLTKGMTVKDVYVAMKSAGAENLPCMYFSSSKNGPFFVFRLDDGLSFQMAVRIAGSDVYYPEAWSINNDWTWTNVSAEKAKYEQVWERFEHYAYVTSSEQPTQSTGTVEIVDGIPTVLPNGNAFDVKLCVDFEDSSAYTLSGKSFEAKSFRWNASGIRGKGIAIGLADEKNDNRRAEVQVAPAQPIEIGGCSGILFWVDFSGTDVNNEKNGVCASVSMNGNDYRTSKNSNGSVGYFLLDGKWIETKNVNACRLELPHQYKGWVYVPASSYQDTRDMSEIVDQNGNFKELSAQSLRLYTDYYNMEKTAEIIFDEILFVKAK